MFKRIQFLLLSAVLVVQMLFGLGISYAENGSNGEQETAVYSEAEQTYTETSESADLAEEQSNTELSEPIDSEVTDSTTNSTESTAESTNAAENTAVNEEVIAAKDYTFVIIPDSQILTQDRPDIFKKMVEWIITNKEDLNIQMVLHMGDVVNRGQNDKKQYQTAKDMLDLIDKAGIPMMIDMGNHDYDNLLSTNRDSTLFNKYFGVERYNGKTWFGGAYEEGKSENVFAKMEVEGTKYLFFALEFAPRDEVLQWVDQIMDENPDHKAVISTHSYVSNKGGRTGEAEDTGDPQEKYKGAAGANDGKDMWEKSFKKHGNLEAVYSGHIFNPGVAYQTDLGDNGNVVFQSLQDFQGLANGGQGRLRIVKYLPSEKKVVSWIFNTWTGKIENTIGNDLEYSTEKPADPNEWKQLKYFKGITMEQTAESNTTVQSNENEAETASQTVDKIPAETQEQQSSAEAAPEVVITDVNKAKEIVYIKNKSDKDVDMTGWKVKSLLFPAGTDETYTFPDNYILKAGGTVQVLSGPTPLPGEGKLVWNKLRMWDNDERDPAVLLNSRGDKISEFVK